MNPDDAALCDVARAWAEADPDATTRAETTALLDVADGKGADAGAARVALYERFATPLTFGTAGLRGVVGAGPARMNHAVVRRTTAALADYLRHSIPDAGTLPVVVGFDARRSSRAFAETVIAVLAAARVPVRYFAEPVPTPVVAYALRQLGAVAAIVVTASHNPREYNGYKLYGATGSQIIAPVDAEIERRIRAIGPASAIPVTSFHLGDESPFAASIPPAFIDRYLADIDALRPRGPADRRLSIVYTPLHGVGGAIALRALVGAGFVDVISVPEQSAPDGDFPTVRFPNPEEPGTMDLATALALERRADLVLANDPDADRLAVAVTSAAGRVVMLSGNQVGVLLADFLLAETTVARTPLVVWSIVSSPLLQDVAAAYGAHAERTLTGFKWIAHAAVELESRGGFDFVFGYEEALGYAVGRLVRDKDGISAALVFAELAARCRAAGESVLDRLARLYRRHGLWVSAQKSLARSGPSGVAELVRAVERFAADPPAAIRGHVVTRLEDFRSGAEERPPWLGDTPLLVLHLDSGRVLLRPSGTEPKLKIYVDLREMLAPEAAVWDAESRLTVEAVAIAADVAARLDGYGATQLR